MNINQTVVQIIGDRILNGGINPKTNKPFQLTDVINADYKIAIENYIVEKSGAIDMSNTTAPASTPVTNGTTNTNTPTSTGTGATGTTTTASNTTVAGTTAGK